MQPRGMGEDESICSCPPHASRASILEQLLKAVALEMLPEALDDLRAANEASDALSQGVIGGNAGTGEDEKGPGPLT